MAFIVFEGGEGVGKTTQVERIYDAFLKKHKNVIKTREPGGTLLAEKIRGLFKEKNQDPPCALTEVYLIAAARNQHVERVLLPALEKKNIILCDRFLDSTYVYQAILGGVSKNLLDTIMSPALHHIMPNLTFVFDCDPAVAASRMKREQTRDADRLDSFNMDIHAQISSGFKQIMLKNFPYPNGIVPKRVLVDASLTADKIFNFLLQEIHTHTGFEL